VNIPTQEALDITDTRLASYNDQETTQQIILLLNTILQQNYFNFKEQFFQPDKELLWGLPSQAPWKKYFYKNWKALSSNNHLMIMPETC
jgi:hypothetical protein